MYACTKIYIKIVGTWDSIWFCNACAFFLLLFRANCMLLLSSTKNCSCRRKCFCWNSCLQSLCYKEEQRQLNLLISVHELAKLHHFKWHNKSRWVSHTPLIIVTYVLNHIVCTECVPAPLLPVLKFFTENHQLRYNCINTVCIYNKYVQWG